MSTRRSVADAYAWFASLHEKLTDHPERDRQGHPQGDQRAPRLPPQRRPRLSPPRPHQRHALRRREPAHPPRHARSAPASRRPLRPRRALDRPPPARQRPPPRDAQRLATSATPSSSSSTTRTRSAHADHVIDIGPGAGVHGGQVIGQGTLAELLACETSLTADVPHRRGARSRSTRRRRKGNGKFVDRRQDATRQQPQERRRSSSRSAPSPASPASAAPASPRSSTTSSTPAPRAALNGARIAPRPVHDGIDGLEQIDKVIDIDQSPIGRTPRSNPATYTGVFTLIRELFAGLPEAKARGYKPGRFSFNVKGGRCEACQGDGVIASRCTSSPTSTSPARSATARATTARRSRSSSSGKSIADVLDLTVEEARRAASRPSPASATSCATLQDVGLGYIKLGQSATTLSGGEAQRVKLRRSCRGAPPARRSTSSTSRPPACTSRTSASCSTSSTASSTRATPWS